MVAPAQRPGNVKHLPPSQVSLWLVVKQAPSNKALALPLLLFGTHLALGNMWNVIFFGRHELKASLKWMGAFWLSIAGGPRARAHLPPRPAPGSRRAGLPPCWLTRTRLQTEGRLTHPRSPLPLPLPRSREHRELPPHLAAGQPPVRPHPGAATARG